MREGIIDYLGVLPKDLATGALWPQIETLLARAVVFGRGEYTLDDIRDGIERDEMFVLGAVENLRVSFCATCSIVQYPRRRVLYVQYGAGLGGERAREALIDAANTLSCDWIETRCRESVARLYRKAGFDIGYSVAILDLEH